MFLFCHSREGRNSYVTFTQKLDSNLRGNHNWDMVTRNDGYGLTNFLKS